MSWLDDARLKIAKRKAEEKARAEANEAKQAAAQAKLKAKNSDKFAREVMRLLPRGVELVGVISYREGPGIRVHVGNGVQFDLEYTCIFTSTTRSGDKTTYVEGNWVKGGLSFITAYEAGSDHSNAHSRVSTVSTSNKDVERLFEPKFSKAQMEELLLKALENQDAKRKAK